ncbi:restriction endonuclease subunit S [Limosilactobacillus sp. RRLNB_1_1]|uniref:Restriction endonuclease subunit S n=2 Tax=Limosilactobacillus albertensis TaxID=2759752 RepID=A0A7W3TQ78_9LACO|nr:restriction endonuclease subunit S [Limosilactobacillus albertensis]
MKMKDSGIAWIGRIPENWKTVKIKYCLSRNEKKNHPNAPVLSVYRDYGVVPKDSRDDNHNVTSSDTSNYKYVVKGNLVINKMKAWQGSLAVSRHTGIVSPAYYVYQFTNSKLNKAYFHYLIRNCYKDEFRRLSTGIRDGQWDLQAYDFENTLILLPSQLEQQQIADFLDSKTAEIDGLIDKINAEIEVLQQYQNSIINQAVTKGLDPNVPMKDSGIAWVGEIPETWEVARGKNILTLLNREVRPQDEIVTAFRDGQVTLRRNRRTDGFTISTKEIGYQGVRVNDLVVHAMDGFAGAIGISDSNGKSSPVLNVLDSNQNKKYIMYYLRVCASLGVFQALAKGIRIRTADTRWDTLRNLNYLLPSRSEQQQIANFLDHKTAEIKRLIKSKQQQINQLTEYKNSLIFEYVTGKKQVEWGELNARPN